MTNPLISVVMPVYNGERFLAAAVESVLKQSYRNFELLLLNDGSTDNTLSILNSFRDDRIKVINSEKNYGLVHQLNLGVSTASGKYVARMDADDLCLPTRFQVQVDFMENNPKIGLCGTFAQSFDSNKKYFVTELPTTHDEICAYLLFGSPFFHPAIMIRKSVLVENKITYRQGTDSCEDYYLYTDLHCVTKFSNLAKVGLQYRLHNSNMSKTHSNFQKQTTNARRESYVQDFLKSEGNDASGRVREHLKFCDLVIRTRNDFEQFMMWVMYLASVNKKRGSWDEIAFLKACAHFTYRKLVASRFVNPFSLRMLMTRYARVFKSLPSKYKILFVVRSLKSLASNVK